MFFDESAVGSYVEFVLPTFTSNVMHKPPLRFGVLYKVLGERLEDKESETYFAFNATGVALSFRREYKVKDENGQENWYPESWFVKADAFKIAIAIASGMTRE